MVLVNVILNITGTFDKMDNKTLYLYPSID